MPTLSESEAQPGHHRREGVSPNGAPLASKSNGRHRLPEVDAAPRFRAARERNEGPLSHSSGFKTVRLGFTLIELLVVIAVIAILAALLLPTLSRARAAADKAVCLNNLRQQGVGLRLYIDNNGVYPGWSYGLNPDVPTVSLRPEWGWLAALKQATGAQIPGGLTSIDSAGFLKNPLPTILTCPSYLKLKGLDLFPYGYNYGGVSTSLLPFGGPLGGKDRYQLGLAGETRTDNDWPSLPTDRVRSMNDGDVVNPAQMIAIGDAIVGLSAFPPFISGAGDLSWGIASPNVLNDAAGVPQALRRRHNSKFNILFCDGHVFTMQRNQLFDSKNLEVRRLWNNDHEPHLEFPSR